MLGRIGPDWTFHSSTLRLPELIFTNKGENATFGTPVVDGPHWGHEAVWIFKFGFWTCVDAGSAEAELFFVLSFGISGADVEEIKMRGRNREPFVYPFNVDGHISNKSLRVWTKSHALSR